MLWWCFPGKSETDWRVFWLLIDWGGGGRNIYFLPPHVKEASVGKCEALRKHLTSPKPPFPRSLYCLKLCLVTGCLEEEKSTRDECVSVTNEVQPLAQQRLNQRLIRDLSPLQHLPLQKSVKEHAVLVLDKGLPAQILVKLSDARNSDQSVKPVLVYSCTRHVCALTLCRHQTRLHRDQPSAFGCRPLRASARWPRSGRTEGTCSMVSSVCPYFYITYWVSVETKHKHEPVHATRTKQQSYTLFHHKVKLFPVVVRPAFWKIFEWCCFQTCFSSRPPVSQSRPVKTEQVQPTF